MWICCRDLVSPNPPERVRGPFTVTQLFSSVVKEKKDPSLGDNLRGAQAAFGKYLSTCLVLTQVLWLKCLRGAHSLASKMRT